MTAEHARSPLEGRADDLGRFAAHEVPFLAQIDLRIARSGADPLPPFLPLETNIWLGWNGRDVLWLGPDEWLVLDGTGATEPAELLAELRTLLSGTHHSVVDVSANRTVLELIGDDRYQLLSTGCGLDLHPRSWRDGMCAQTLLARVPVILQERSGATRVFVRPSYAEWLLDWLLDAAEGSA
ncbi:MAG: sarcosine oxidase subunit gamma family protein [Actinomycetota bacterium]